MTSVVAITCLAYLLIIGSLFNPATKPGPSGAIGRCEITYLALGDSTGVGVGSKSGRSYVDRLFDQINRERPGSSVVNRSQIGADAQQVLGEQMTVLSIVNPSLVTLEIGANDLLRHARKKEFAKRYESIVAGLRRRATRTIILMNIPDFSRSPVVSPNARHSTRRRIAAFNKRIEIIGRKYRVAVVDLYARTPAFSRDPARVSSDGIHPSDAGYEFWTRAVWPIIQTSLNNNRCRER
jgi:lysophospholipase L1-like esterase